MAWRPSVCLIEGELDNTTLGHVTGWMQFTGMENKVTFVLRGDFHRDIRGATAKNKSSGQRRYDGHSGAAERARSAARDPVFA
jgi:hypothetical protein